MAPEQHRAEPADPRTDQFSFCVALHEGLYGRRPFLGDTYSELVSNVLDGVITPPAFNRGVPPAVYQVLLRGLRNDRETRYLAMDPLLDDLLAFAELDDRPGSPGAPAERARPAAGPTGADRGGDGRVGAAGGPVALGIEELCCAGTVSPDRRQSRRVDRGEDRPDAADHDGQAPQTTRRPQRATACAHGHRRCRLVDGDAGAADETSIASGETQPATRTAPARAARAGGSRTTRDRAARSTDAAAGEQSHRERRRRRRRELELSPL